MRCWWSAPAGASTRSCARCCARRSARRCCARPATPASRRDARPLDVAATTRRRSPRGARRASTSSSSGPRRRSSPGSPTRCAGGGRALLRPARGRRAAGGLQGLRQGGHGGRRRPDRGARASSTTVERRPRRDRRLPGRAEGRRAGRRQGRRHRRGRGRGARGARGHARRAPLRRRAGRGRGVPRRATSCPCSRCATASRAVPLAPGARLQAHRRRRQRARTRAAWAPSRRSRASTRRARRTCSRDRAPAGGRRAARAAARPSTASSTPGSCSTADGPRCSSSTCASATRRRRPSCRGCARDLLELLQRATRARRPGRRRARVGRARGGHRRARRARLSGVVVHAATSITGLDEVPAGVEVTHAGTAERDGEVVTAGGRVLERDRAGRRRARPPASAAYAAADMIHFEGRQLRRDIALRRGDGHERAMDAGRAETVTRPRRRFEEIEVDAPRVGILMGSKSDMAAMEAAGEGARGARDPPRGPRDVGPPRPRHGRRLRQERPDARAQGDHRRRRPVRRAAGRRRRPHRPAGHRRPADLVASVAGGLDALLSIAQMPPGVPVACVGRRQRAQRRGASPRASWRREPPRARRPPLHPRERSDRRHPSLRGSVISVMPWTSGFFSITK